MQEKIDTLISEIEKFAAQSKEEVEGFRIKYFGKKGVLADLFSEMKSIAPEMRKDFGQMVNSLKVKAEERLESFQQALESASDSQKPKDLDLTLPGESNAIGSRHPLSLVRNEILNIFKRIGFTVADGPEIEDDWHDFTALNFPENHPARDMQDTFFISQEGSTDSISLYRILL